jgi:RNA polymerase sigma-70 factor, ECF subfamily
MRDRPLEAISAAIFLSEISKGDFFKRISIHTDEDESSFLKMGEFVKPPVQEITQWLINWSNGDQDALNRLIPLVYEELRRLSKHYMREERRRARGLITMQSEVLINEAYLRLIDVNNVQWQNRAHFFAIAAQIMRRILVDYARSRHYLKRGGGAQHVTLEEASVFSQERPPDLIALDDALSALARIDERKGRVVELRFFGGFSVEETAEVLRISPVTVMRDWRLAKSWLLKELSERGSDDT